MNRYDDEPRFPRASRPPIAPLRFGADDDDPYGEEERGILADIGRLGDTPEDRAERAKMRARLSALRAARMDRNQSAEDRKRARQPIFQEQERERDIPTTTATGTVNVPSKLKYRVKIDPDTGAVIDETFLESQPNRAAIAQEEATRRGTERFEFEKAQAAETKNRSDYRFAAGEAASAKAERVRVAEREQDRKDALERQARADEAERYRLREYYDRLAQGANFESAQRRQAEANRQEQAGFQQQANVQREDAAIKYASQLERLLAEPARFWSSIGSNPAQIEKVVNQLVQYNFGGRFDRLIAMLRAGPEQQRQPALAAPRFGGRV